VQLIVTAHCAPDAAGDCWRSAVACRRVLRRHGIANITSARQEWWTDRNTYALLLRDRDTGEPLGGVRLQLRGDGVPLPIELALGRVDARVHSWVAGFAAQGVGELCGLWCSPRITGLGLGRRLTCMGIALAEQLHVGTLLGLCDTRNVHTNLDLGFSLDTSLASGGSFQYPRPGLFAHVLLIPDTGQLTEASPEAQSAVAFYRRAPAGVQTLRTGEDSLDLHRDLRLRSLAAEARRTRAAHAAPGHGRAGRS